MNREPESIREFVSARTFQLWDFRISHAMLLIRSPSADWAAAPGEPASANLDLMFTGVDYLDVRQTLHGLRVTEAPGARLAEVAAGAGVGVYPSTHLFRLESEGRVYHVVAGGLAVLGTTSSPMESSLVLHWSPKDGETQRYRDRYLVSYALFEGPP